MKRQRSDDNDDQNQSATRKNPNLYSAFQNVLESDEREKEITESEMEDEDMHMVTVLEALNSYERFQMAKVDMIEHNYRHLVSRESDRLLLPSTFEEGFDRVRDGIRANYDFLLQILEPHLPENRGEQATVITSSEGSSDRRGRKMPLSLPQFSKQVVVGSDDMQKLQSTLKQFVREWSNEGREERDKCFGPLLQELERQFPDRAKRPSVKVITPGVGLGRLTFEVARRGFNSQGNEFSFYMLLSSNLILNRSRKNQYTIYPYLHERSNIVKRENQTRAIRVPDVNLSTMLPEDCGFSMVAGDFIEVYGSKPGDCDCIVTCFFLDTAKNVLEYVKTIHTALKPGGVWINMGPLLYHYEDVPQHMSLELSFDELRHVIAQSGFTIQREERKQTTYSANSFSMYQVHYDCILFTAIKE